MDLSGMGGKDIVNLAWGKDREKLSDDDWLQIQGWITEYERNGVPEDEKKYFGPLGIGESVGIICDGIIRRRNAICTKCSNATGLRSCEIYNDEIPGEIWTAGESARCEYFSVKRE